MKIDITNKSPYQAVIDAITELDKEDGLTVECCRIVRIRLFRCLKLVYLRIAAGRRIYHSHTA